MVIHCSKALQTALKLNKTDMATPEQLGRDDDFFYSWHGYFAKVDGRNTIVLMDDKTIYCIFDENFKELWTRLREKKIRVG